MTVRVRTELTPDAALHAVFKACRNDECSELLLSGSARQLPDERPSALTPEEHELRAREGNGASLSWSADADPVELWLVWHALPDHSDRDRYRLSAELSDGHTIELIDEMIEYHEELVLEGTDCELSCKVGMLEIGES